MRKGGIVLAGTALAALSLSAPAMADTLKEALAEAYENNPTLESARASQRALDETVPIERADGLPSVTGSASYFEFIDGGNGAARSTGLGVDLGVPLYTGGAVRRSIQAAETRVEAGRADLRGTESALFTQVVGAYMDVIQNEAIVGLSQTNVDVLAVNFEATGDRFEIGDLTLTDVAQSESRLALARSDLRSAQANLINARERYIQLVGSEPDDLQPPPPLPGLPATPQEAVLIALENNPDLIAAEERARAAGIDIAIARAGRLPRVEGFVNAGYDNTLGSINTANLPPGVVVTNGSTDVTAGVRATIPIFTGGRTGAFIRQSQARREAALEQVIAVERDIVAQVRGAYASWEAANAIIASTQVAVEAAELSLEGVRAENSVGNRTILDVLNAEQELLRARVQLVTARRNAYVAGFSLLAAMGRAEARDLGLEEYGPLYDPAANLERVRDKLWDWGTQPDPTASATRTVDTEAQDGEISQQP